MDRENMGKSEDYFNQAAVLVAVAGDGDRARVLLTLRASHLTSHANEVAFPGGKWEAQDMDLAQTALRESHEEVGLNPRDVEMIGKLPATYTGGGVRVTPFYGRVAEDLNLAANPNELESLFWLPVSFIHKDPRVRTDIFSHSGKDYWSPVYHYSGYTIWGFTARVLVEFSNCYFGTCIGLEHPAPSQRYCSD